MIAPSSGQLYRDYRHQLRDHSPESKRPASSKAKSPKARGFGQLFWEFLRLLRGHHWAIGFALATLTLATVLRLVPPLATKLVVDNLLNDQPLPAWWAEQYG